MNKKGSRSSLKIIIASVLAVVVLAGAVFGARAYISSGKSTGVISVMNVADTWIDSGSAGYGQISQGGTQMVYLDTSMLVSQIYVSVGDHVSKGDPLMQYDASQAKLAADSYRIRYEMAKRDLNEAREYLEYLKTFKPYVEPTPIYKIYKTRVNVLLEKDGITTKSFEADSIKGEGTKEKPFIIDVNLETEISREMMEYLLTYDDEAILPNTVPKEKPVEEPVEGTDEEDASNPDDAQGNEGTEPADEEKEIEYEESTVQPQKYFEFHIWESFQGMDSVLVGTVSSKENEDGIHRDAWMKGMFDNKKKDYFTFADLFKMMPNGDVVPNDLDADMFIHAQQVFSLSELRTAIPDPVEVPETQMYSQEQIDEMILSQTQTIRSMEIEVSQAELDWRKAKQTSTDGIVRAAQDGVVTAAGDPFAPQGDQALIQVKNGDGYEIVSTISEIQLGSINVGDQISVMMWSNGMTYTGTIKEISPYPAQYSMNYSGDSANMSYYPFTAVLDCEDELQPWDGGEIRFLKEESGGKAEFALQSSFVREENGMNFVLKANEEGRLEKQYIQVGRILYGGYYVEVYSGLSLQDYIAFPYGKNAVEGAKADYESGVMGW
ncbi:MAG: hypothetical protein IJ091_08810 [Oscillospiraceae bacterium]|nr:hypothetical protein [Oscillospiraceae bacterium]